MSKDIANPAKNLPSDPTNLAQGLANMQHVATQDNATDHIYLRFRKGEYIYGVDSIAVDPDSTWAVNPHSFVHGYQAWGNSELLGERTAPMTSPPVIKDDLPEYEYIHSETLQKTVAKWSAFRGFQLVCVAGDDEGLLCFISNTSKGFTKATTTLVTAIIKQMKIDPMLSVPIITLEVSSYEHKKWGEIFTPIFTVHAWSGLEDDAFAPMGEEGEEEEEEEEYEDEDLEIDEEEEEGEEEEEEEEPDPKPKAKAKVKTKAKAKAKVKPKAKAKAKAKAKTDKSDARKAATRKRQRVV